MSEWRKCKLGEHIELLTGFPFKSAQFSNHGIRLARGDNVKRGSFEWGEKSRYWEEITPDLEPYQLRTGDVLVGMDGSRVGENWARIQDPDLPCLLVQRVARLRAGGKLRQDYLWYLIANQRFTAYVKAVHTGTSIPHISGKQINNFPVVLPSLEEQCLIASILSALDDKIDLNRRMNETLEAMARAIFKSWFIDFDPVHAKSQGQQPAHMPPETAALFPDSLDEDGKPEGWTNDHLISLAALNPETWSKKTAPAKIEYVDLANTKWGVIESTKIYNWSDAPSRARQVLSHGDTIIGTVRPGNGSYSYIGADGLTGSTGFAVLRATRREFREFVYLAATYPENIQRLAHLADGAAYPAVRPDVVGATEISCNDEKLIACFSKLVAPFLSQAEANKQQNQTLVQIRDLLLPKLISGEVPVKKTENSTGQVT